QPDRFVLPDLIAELHEAVGNPFEAGQASQQRRLSRSGRPEDGGNTRHGNIQIDVQVKGRKTQIKPCQQTIHDAWIGNRRFTIYTVNNTRNEKVSIKAEIACACAYSIPSTCSKIVVDRTRVCPGIEPPTMSTTPNSPIVCANPSTIALIYPLNAIGDITVKNASSFDARRDQAASNGPLPTA